MKYLFLFLISGVIVACNSTDKTASAADQAKRDSLNYLAMSDSANFTSLQWLDSVNQNLGKVNEGQVLEIAWHFKNTGNKPLIIGRVQPGCGCTLAEQPQEPIAPGKDGVIKAKFDSKGHPNVQDKVVYVYANNINKNNGENNLLRFHVEVTPSK
jgi:hypothetical protein